MPKGVDVKPLAGTNSLIILRLWPHSLTLAVPLCLSVLLVGQAMCQDIPRLNRFEIEAPAVVLVDIPFDVVVSAVDQFGNVMSDRGDTLSATGLWLKRDDQIESRGVAGPLENGTFMIKDAVIRDYGTSTIGFQSNEIDSEHGVYAIPGILSILPPVLAILLALVLRQVVLSLFFGIWLGAVFLNHYNPIIGFLRALDQFIVGAASNSNNMSVAIFSLMLGGMVGIISKSGGTAGIVQTLTPYAKTRKSGQIAAWAMGLFIFFDDYSNSLVVGNTMRPLTDKLRISREKLSYIVDSTAAPIASIAVVSTWVGYQSGLISLAFTNLGIEQDGYFVFFQSIPYSFYCILALVVVFIFAITNRDFGAMREAESRVIATGEVLRPGAVPLSDTQAMELSDDEDSIPLRWYNAVVPVAVMIVTSAIGLYFGGLEALGDDAQGAGLIKIIGAADSFKALLWGTTTGVLTAGLMATGQRILNLVQVMDAWLSGLKAMLLAIVILVLAWSIGNICTQLNTAGYIVQATQGLFTPHLLPALTFIVASLIAFSTGTSWATMAILTPLVIPLSYQMSIDAGISEDMASTILLATIAAVLSGSVFGDHSSPISDTTILSSMASGSDHIDHVRTQIPYAFMTAVIAIFLGYIPVGFGFSPLILIPLNIVAAYLIIRFVGKPLE